MSINDSRETRMRSSSQPPAERSTGPTPLAFDPRDLRGLEPARRFPGRNRTKADLLVFHVAGRSVAVKDYGPRGWWVRRGLGPWLVRREVAAYRALEGVDGLPRLLGTIGPLAFATAWIEARPLSEIDPTRVEERWLDALLEIVEDVHRRGVALGDLHHRDVLVDDAGGVHVVDLATAWICPHGNRGMRRAVFRRLCELDLLAVARMRARAAGRDPDEEVRRIGGRAARWHRRGRGAKRWIERLRRG
jgi:hypothetical protein